MKNDGHTGNEDADGLDARDDAALWALLGQAKQPGAGPYFARRVLREVSLHEEAQAAARWWQPAVLRRLFERPGRVAFLAGTPAAALLLVFAGMQLNALDHRRQLSATVSTGIEPAARVPVVMSAAVLEAADSVGHDALTAPPVASVVAPASPDEVSEQDVEVIADLDTLLKSEQSRLWTEDTARF